MTDDINNILNDLNTFLNDAQKNAIKEILDKFKYFLSFNDLSRFILLTLEKYFNFDNDILQKLGKHFSNISKNTISSLPLNIPKDLTMPNYRAINYTNNLTSFYFGKFFNQDKNIHKQVLNWLNNYYLKEGNPIGKKQKGINDFLNNFSNFLTQKTQSKARQIIDTSISHIKASSTIRQMHNSKIQFYRWDGTNDRLTCNICRSMDGRIFKTSDAIKLLEQIETSEPDKLPLIKPFISTSQNGKSQNIKSILAPAHPNCRCRMQAHFDDNSIVTSVQRPTGVKYTDLQKELEDQFNNLSNQERINKIKAHLSATWVAKNQKGQFDFEKKHLKIDHYKKHSEIGLLNVSSLEDYVNQSYDIIKNPDNIYIQKHREKLNNGKILKTTKYVFEKNRKIVVVNDDNLVISSYHKLYDEYNNYLDRFINEKNGKVGIIKIL
ncbi:MAG: phage head morphogenesis protein [Candidatus Dojkabacteria bacterium]|nr:phage head morphogenesis protein [Candidatus Dojkabacteria bacterium]